MSTFARELEETLLKDTLAQYVRAQRGDVLAGAGFDELECLITDGHPYHPAFKSRIGFDLEDNLRWGPEFARPQRPLWLAAHLIPVAVDGESVQREPGRRVCAGGFAYLRPSTSGG